MKTSSYFNSKLKEISISSLIRLLLNRIASKKWFTLCRPQKITAAAEHINHKALYAQQTEKIAELNGMVAVLSHQLEQLKKNDIRQQKRTL